MIRTVMAAVVAAGALALVPSGTAAACCKPPKFLVGVYPTLAECQAHQTPVGECKRLGDGRWGLYEMADPV
ncbi:hypothetical protein LWC34_24335 [Kibdelosporangium philippinense]|uniref:Uncharacterized protein n=1 Tax=Kibdelosporangium philippinense TaxID=211113 RepID=A0ABS8ZF67_9PSEU|nr:hypothetical protein [Kibdelosporangium philippinense]MCE7005934.1 hypothetical protein [Kibdelosporangium philippinense]